MYDDVDATETRPSQRRAGQRAASPRWVLRLVFPSTVAARIALPGAGSVSLGRNGPPLEVPDPSVSRSHLTFSLSPRGGSLQRGRVSVVDAGSRNGTWVDGVRVREEPVWLDEGAVLRIGDVLGVLECDEPDDDGVVRQSAVFGDASPMRALRRRLPALAVSAAPVLLLGETGTGKELLAREVHRLSGREPFVALNCAGLSPELADSQLFGHVRGAFTGADRAREGAFRAAAGGTLFLDEVAELAPRVQAKLLRAVETRTVVPLGSDDPVEADARIVAATHPDLLERVEDGGFRRDLYARLAMAEVELPPLSERRGDVLGWIGVFDARWRESDGGPPLLLSSDALELLMLRAWPENLRGLDRAVFLLRSNLVSQGGRVDGAHVNALLPPEPTSASAPVASSVAPPVARKDKPTEAELRDALARFEGSVRAVAKHYGRDRRQIYRWMDAYGLR